MKNVTRVRVAAATVATAILVLGAPLAASAHVHIIPDQAAAGTEPVVTFTVPNESASAGTVRVELDLPTAHPFTSVSYQQVPGWTTAVTTEHLPKPVKTDTGTITEAPVSVIWTANPGVQITDGQIQQFVVNLGSVPNTGTILLPVRQTYSDGTVVTWDQPTPASGVEPERPAPTLYVNDTPPTDNSPGAPTVSASQVGGQAAADAAQTQLVAVGLGIGGLALGAIALIVGVLALVRHRRPTGTSPAGPSAAGTVPATRGDDIEVR